MIKTVFVKAKFKSEKKDIIEKKPVGYKNKNWYSSDKELIFEKVQKQEIKESDCEIDDDELSIAINHKLEELNNEGYKLISITPVISGRYKYNYSAQGISSSPRIFSETEKVSGGGSFGYGYGYSFTEGVLICVQK